MAPLIFRATQQAELRRLAGVRQARNRLLGDLRRGQLTLGDVLARTDEVAGDLTLLAVVETQPGINQIRAQQLLQELRLPELRRLRRLRPRQKQRLLAYFAHRS